MANPEKQGKCFSGFSAIVMDKFVAIPTIGRLNNVVGFMPQRLF